MMFTVSELLTKYETSVGRNTNMLLGLVVNDKGLIPEADVRQVEALGKEIVRQYGTPLKQTSGTGSEYIISFDKPVSINRVLMQEDISNGERVLKYSLKGKKNKEWIDLSAGSCIGHKHIDRFEPQTIDAIKLVVTESKADPQIKNFSIFETL